MKSTRKVFGFLSHPKIQLKYGFGFALFVSSTTMLINFIFVRYFILQNLSSDYGSVKNLDVILEKLPLYSSLLIFLICFFSVFFCLLFITHRFIGPAITIERVLGELHTGNYSNTIVLRNEDELKSIAEKVNQLSQELQRKLS